MLPLILAIGLFGGAPEGSVGKPEAWVVEGRVSDNPHQHPIQPSKGQHILYVDTVAEGQIVAYLETEAPPSGAWARFSGTALRFETTSKRPGSTKKFPVKQLTVEKVERLAGSDAVQALVGGKAKPSRAELEKAGKDAVPVVIAALDSREWEDWWLAHRDAPFDGMRADVARLYDEYFKSGSAR